MSFIEDFIWHRNFWVFRVATLSGALALAGCSTPKADLDLVYTTYPRHPRTIQNVAQIAEIEYSRTIKLWNSAVVNSARGVERYSYDTFVTKTGDDATIETFIHDPKSTNANQEHLLNIAKQRGSELCGGRFGILETTYFYGDEATPKFYGLANAKSMRTIFRCPLKFSSAEVVDNRDLIALANELLWPTFFDVLTIDFQKQPQELIVDIRAAAITHGISQLKSGKLDSSRYFYLGSGKTSSRSKHQRIEQLAAIVEPANGGSRLQIIFPAMRFQLIRTSVSTIRKIPDQWGDLVPWERSVAYDRARLFLSVVARDATGD